MNINQYIESLLSGYVEGNIWPLVCPLENKPNEFIVYGPEDDSPEDSGDDEDQAWVYRLEINWYKRGPSKTKPANYIKARRDIRDILRHAGFTVTNIMYYHESDTGFTRLTFLAWIEEDDYGDQCQWN